MKLGPCVGGFCLAVVVGVQTALAAPITFNIDPQLSSLTFSLGAAGVGKFTSAQTPGADTSALFGTLDTELEVGSVQFLTTGNVQFSPQALPQSPLPNGLPGTAQAQFGLNAAAFALSGTIAGRNFLGDATSSPIALAGTSFDASQLTVNLLSGDVDYNLVFMGSPVVGRSTENFPALNTLNGGTLVSNGSMLTLTVPIHVEGSFSLQGLRITPVYSGIIVATASVPEPSSWMLLAVGGLSILIFTRHRAQA